MVDDERSYVQQRAEIEVERARMAIAPGAAIAHRQLAQAYPSRIAADGPAAETS